MNDNTLKGIIFWHFRLYLACFLLSFLTLLLCSLLCQNKPGETIRLWDSQSCLSCPEIAFAFYSYLIAAYVKKQTYSPSLPWSMHLASYHCLWTWVTFLICSKKLLVYSSQSVFCFISILHVCYDGVYLMWNTMRRDQIRNPALGPCDLSLAVEVYVRSMLSWLT